MAVPSEYGLTFARFVQLSSAYAKSPASSKKAVKKKSSKKTSQKGKSKAKVKKAKAKVSKLSVALSWKKVKNAAKYVVQMKHKGKWITVKTILGKKSGKKARGKPKAAYTVKSFYDAKGNKTPIDSGVSYKFRIMSYKAAQSETGKTKYQKLAIVYKITAKTLPEDPTDLPVDFIYQFNNSLYNFYRQAAAKSYVTWYRPASDPYTPEQLTVEAQYYVNRNDYERLIAVAQESGLSFIDAVNVVNRKTVERPWQGSCYGMSISTLLNCYRHLDVCAWVSEGDDNKIGKIKRAPAESLELLSLINYYQVSWGFLKHSDYDANAVAQEIISPEGLLHARELSFWWQATDSSGKSTTMGHAILLRKHAEGVQGVPVTAGPHSGGTCWAIRTYDPNFPLTWSFDKNGRNTPNKTYLRVYRDSDGTYTLEVDYYPTLLRYNELVDSFDDHDRIYIGG